MEHYQDELKVKNLMELGDLSSLGAELGVQHPFEEQSDEYCTAYERDRGERNVQAKTIKGKKNLLEASGYVGIEHIYLFINGHWSWLRVNGGTRWRKLTKEIVAVDYLEKLVLSEITATAPDAPVTSVEGT
jgi:hypothetical protein